MASASSQGCSSASAFSGASQPASEDRGASRGVARKAGAAASSSPTLPRGEESNASAAQPGPPTKQQRLTAIAAGIGTLQGYADTNSSAAQPGAAATAAQPVEAVPPSPIAARAEHMQRSILQYGSSTYGHARVSSPPSLMREYLKLWCRIECVSGAVKSQFRQWLRMKLTRAGEDPEIFCHHVFAFLIGPLGQRLYYGLDSNIPDLIRVARISSSSLLVRVQARRDLWGPQERRPLQQVVRKRQLARRARQLLGRMGIGGASQLVTLPCATPCDQGGNSRQ